MLQPNEILKAYGTDYKEMTIELLKESALSDIIGDRERRIGIKPNLVSPSPASFGATTHPEVVSGIIEYLKAEGFSDITVLEGSWVGDRTQEAFEYCGYNALAKTYGVRLFDTQKDSSYESDCGDGIRLNICSIMKSIDFLINVPVVKGHCQTVMTCAMKNLKGLIPNSEKRRFHTMGLHKPIAYLQKAIHQDFIVADNICGDLDFEDGGNPVVMNCVLAARDPLLLDCLACGIKGCNPEDVGYIRIAEKLGIGSTDLENAVIRTIRKNGETYESEGNIRRSLLDVSYAAEEVDSCSACYASLTGALLRLNEEGLLKELKDRISIGQGFRGRTGKLGIGACTKGFSYTIAGCPPEEEDIYEGLKRYIRESR